MESCWKGVDTVLPPLHSFAIKLKAVKAMLQRWNREVFGDVFKNIRRAEDAVLVAQYTFDTDPSEEHAMVLETARNTLSQKDFKEEETKGQNSMAKGG